MSPLKKKCARPLFLAAALLLFASPPADAEKESVDQILMVTAQKTEQNLQDVPLSLDVFSGQDITDKSVGDIGELVHWSPNVHLRQDSFENTLIMRGISSFHTSLNSPAGIYMDDVSLPLVYMHNMDLLDLARVEILRGPQGTLYGKNSESGVVNLVTAKPGDEFSGKLILGAGNYNTYKAGVSMNGPLVKEKLYGGFAFQHNRSDGYVENLFDDSDSAKRSRYNGRGTLRYEASDRLDLTLIMDFLNGNDTNGGKRWITPYPDPSIADAAITSAHKVNHNRTREPFCQDGNGQTLKIDYKGEGFDLVSVTGLRYYDLDAGSDQDMYTALQRKSDFNYTNHLFSQEFRVSSADDGDARFSWLAGVYGSSDTTDVKMDITMDLPGTSMSMIDNDAEIESRGIAFFGQGIWRPVERLHLTGGLRYDIQEMTGKLSSRAMLMTGGFGDLSFNKDLDFSELLPKISLAWDATPDVMTYVTVARGYMSGGYNYAITATSADSKPTVDNFTYDPEFTMNYEVGTKTTWLNGRLNINAALFYIDIKDKQVAQPIAGLPDASEIVNASKARSLGGELDIRFTPMPGVSLFGGVGYAKAEFDDWVDSSGNDLDGKKLPDGPLYTYNLGGAYRHISGLFCRADLLGMGTFYSDPRNTLEQDAYALVNLRLGYDMEKFELALWAKNVFDEEYYKSMGSLVTPGGTAVFAEDGAPRTFGVDLTYRF